MEKEGGRTSVLMRAADPASGGWAWSWAHCHFITLAELLHYGRNLMSCFDLYNMYLQFDVMFFRRNHSVSNTEGAQKRRNAKQLRHSETGRWGLDARR